MASATVGHPPSRALPGSHDGHGTETTDNPTGSATRPGEYTLDVKHGDYDNKTANITLPESGDATRNFILID